MAEDNYLAAINAARQRTRGDVRRRIDQIIDPLDSAAQMDRMQGTSVMQTTGQVDPGAGNIMQFAGGRSAPVRTAVGGGSAPVQATAGIFGRRGGQSTVQGGCANGRCGIGAPPSSEYQVTAPATTTVGQPAKPTAPMTPSAPVSYNDLWEQAKALRYTDPNVAAVTERQALAAGEYAQEDKARDIESAKIQASLTIANQKYELGKSEAGLTDQQAQMTKENTGLGYADTKTKLLQAVHAKQMTPETAVEAIVKMNVGGLPVDDKRKQPGKEANELAIQKLKDVEQDARREVYGSLFIKNALDDSPTLRQHANAMDGADLSGSDETGAPKDIVMRDALEKLAAGYQQAGAFAKPWHEVRMLLENDVGTVLRSSLPRLWLSERQDEFSAMGQQQRAEAEKVAFDQATQYAQKMSKYVEVRVKDMWARNQRGEFDPAQPFAPQKQRYLGGFWPTFDFSEKPVDSNNTMADPPPAKPPAGIDSQTPSRSKVMSATRKATAT